MNEKRFKLVDRNGVYRILDLHKKGKHILTGEENVDLLNSLNDENEQLRKDLSDCEKFRHHIFKKIGELTDERKRD